MALRCQIVDDNASFLEAATDLLRHQGVAVAGVASSGDEAVERVRELRPDVALVDIKLGAESGFDVARRLADLGLVDLKVILVSTHAEADFAELIDGTPVAGFVSKVGLSAGLAHDLEREQRRAPAPHERRDVVPVDVVRDGICDQARQPEPSKLFLTPRADQLVLFAAGLRSGMEADIELVCGDLLHGLDAPTSGAQPASRAASIAGRWHRCLASPC